VESQDEAADIRTSTRYIVVEQADFRVEEYLEAGLGDQPHLQVIRPDAYEDAESDRGSHRSSQRDAAIVEGIGRLSCGEDSDSEGAEELRRRRARRSKRWSGLIKRSHSKSVEGESDSSGSEDLDAHDVGLTARRLRRRTRGPDKRTSLIFDDPPPNIVEVEEPEDDDMQGRSRPPDIATSPLEMMPFWTLADPMEIDSGDSGSEAFSSEDDDD